MNDNIEEQPVCPENGDEDIEISTVSSCTSGAVSPSKSPLMDKQNQLVGLVENETPHQHPTMISTSMPCSPVRHLPEVVDQLAVSARNQQPATSSTLANRFPNIRETMDWIFGYSCFFAMQSDNTKRLKAFEGM
jgi:hypothetical protein